MGVKRAVPAKCPEARPLQRQLQLPLGSRRLARLGVERPNRRIDAERLQDPQHLRADERTKRETVSGARSDLSQLRRASA